MLYIPERPASKFILEAVYENATPSLVLKLLGMYLYADGPIGLLPSFSLTEPALFFPLYESGLKLLDSAISLRFIRKLCVVSSPFWFLVLTSILSALGDFLAGAKVFTDSLSSSAESASTAFQNLWTVIAYLHSNWRILLKIGYWLERFVKFLIPSFSLPELSVYLAFRFVYPLCKLDCYYFGDCVSYLLSFFEAQAPIIINFTRIYN